jgi:adenylate cyclase class 2
MNEEVKILNIDVEKIIKKLEELGAKKVFDNVRVVTYFKNKNDAGKPFLKLTEEDKLKLTSQNLNTHKDIKLFVSRKEECISLLETLGYFAISEVSTHRTSYELFGIDCDIDIFPEIPPFLEIDLGETEITLDDFIVKLNLEDNKKVVMSTPQVVELYGKDYFDLYKK